MLALCLMLSETYYAQNYAGIIGLGLLRSVKFYIYICTTFYSVASYCYSYII